LIPDCQLIPLVANRYHWLPSRQLLPTVKLHGWQQLAAGEIGLQPVESVGNQWNQLAMVKKLCNHFFEMKFSWCESFSAKATIFYLLYPGSGLQYLRSKRAFRTKLY
jgi:hypothetical protein